MFSVIFPGQGSQIVAMGKEFYDKHDFVKTLFKEADEVLGIPISKIILEGTDMLGFITASSADVDVVVSYLDQTL